MTRRQFYSAALIVLLLGSTAARAVNWPSASGTTATGVVIENGSGGLGPASGGTATAIPAGENHIGSVGSDATVAGCTFTRPNDTTAYAIADLVANSTTAGSVTPCTVAVARAIDKTSLISRIRLTKSGTSVTNASFRLHLYKNSPTVTNGDNGAWLSTESTYMGCFDVTVDKVFSDGSKGTGVPCVGNFILAVPSTGTQNIFILIEARAAYIPAAQEIFTPALEIVQN